MNTLNCILAVIAVCVIIPHQITAEPGQQPDLYHFDSNVQMVISKHVSHELSASAQYLAMAAYFGQDDVDLQGFKELFLDKSDTKRDHAKRLINFLNNRNGKLEEIKTEPIKFTGTTGLAALETALKVEYKLTTLLTTMHKLSQTTNDVNLIHALENNQVLEQIATIRQLNGLIAKIKRMSESTSRVGEYLIDQELHAYHKEGHTHHQKVHGHH